MHWKPSLCPELVLQQIINLERINGKRNKDGEKTQASLRNMPQ
jgi:hypothetical protein